MGEASQRSDYMPLSGAASDRPLMINLVSRRGPGGSGVGVGGVGAGPGPGGGAGSGTGGTGSGGIGSGGIGSGGVGSGTGGVVIARRLPAAPPVIPGVAWRITRAFSVMPAGMKSAGRRRPVGER